MSAWATGVPAVPLGAAQVGTAIAFTLTTIGVLFSLADSKLRPERRRAEGIFGIGAVVGIVGALADSTAILSVAGVVVVAGLVYGVVQIRRRGRID